MPSKAKKKKVIGKSELKKHARIQIPVSLYESLVPDHAGLVLRACVNQGRDGITPWKCHTETKFRWRDCVIVCRKLEKLGMLKLQPRVDPKQMSIYTVNSTVELEVDTTKTRTRKRHPPRITTLPMLNAWLADITDDVSVHAPVK